MVKLLDALEEGFRDHVDEVVVHQLGPSHFHIRFKVEGRDFGCAATAIGAGVFAPEDTTFMATTWVHDPLFAFGRQMDWKLIDGFDSGHNPGGEVRAGKPAELADMIRQAATDYAEARWPSPQTEQYAFR